VDKKHVVIGEQLPKMYLFSNIDKTNPRPMPGNRIKRRPKMLCWAINLRSLKLPKVQML
jgi:hypothetical protein